MMNQHVHREWFRLNAEQIQATVEMMNTYAGAEP